VTHRAGWRRRLNDVSTRGKAFHEDRIGASHYLDRRDRFARLKKSFFSEMLKLARKYLGSAKAVNRGA
jgi:hypothetical protein